MALDAAIGIVTTAEEKLGECIANATRFQTITSSANATEAKNHIYYGSLPDPANGSAYTREELEGYRPFAMIWTDENTGLTMAKRADRITWANSGSIFAWFEMDADSNDETQESDRKWKNTIGELLFRTTQPDPFVGILENAGNANFLDIQRVVIREIQRADIKHLDEQGDWMMSIVEFDWGVAE